MVHRGRCAAPLAGPAGRGGGGGSSSAVLRCASRGARPNGGAEVRGAGGHGQRGGAAARLGGAHHQGRLGVLRQVRERGERARSPPSGRPVAAGQQPPSLALHRRVAGPAPGSVAGAVPESWFPPALPSCRPAASSVGWALG